MCILHTRIVSLILVYIYISHIYFSTTYHPFEINEIGHEYLDSYYLIYSNFLKVNKQYHCKINNRELCQ